MCYIPVLDRYIEQELTQLKHLSNHDCTKLSLNDVTYGPSLILSNFGSQTFRKQFCGALKQQKQMALWGDPKSKITRFLYLVYNSNVFAFIIRMSLWRSGSMQLQHAKGPHCSQIRMKKNHDRKQCQMGLNIDIYIKTKLHK